MAWTRGLAFVLDSLICSAMLVPPMMVAWHFRLAWLLQLLLMLSPVWPFIYFWVPTCLWGTTPSKFMFRLQVRDVYGERPHLLRVLARETLKVLSVGSVIGAVCTFVEALCHDRVWYDKVTGTAVVPEFRRQMSGMGFAVVTMTAFLSACAALVGVILVIGAAARSSEAYQLALRELRKSEQVTERLGRPVLGGAPVEVRPQARGEREETTLTFPVTGPKATGTARTTAFRAGGVWQIEFLSVELTGQQRQINVVDARHALQQP